METRIDPYTKEEFVPSRSNQVYASRKNQIDHNNFKAKQQRKKVCLKHYVSDQNLFYASQKEKKIRKNWLIILQLLGDKKKAIFSADLLRGAQFDFASYLGIRKDEKGNTYHAIHTVGIRLYNNTSYEVINFGSHV